ncbi:hypothetical protein SAMN05192534_11045 [Alteribacillus persepolensis]|uniref:Rhodanese domain-containing protein n=1 Tax=Alteribacillus persepolensis TaxID=568899 RepID=A0A1G8ES91_9BACI|nr:hypothetical protein [Alteribacillus persepolensis]SDH72753.1 hypothetical protein SAMN05192534_11045 [Alteribacillus persepolensis]
MTWLIIFLLLLLFTLAGAYKRWMPVFGVKCASLPNQPLPSNTVLLDIRDYQDADRSPVREAYTLPYPYLKRYADTIDGDNVFLIAPDKVSKNLSIRLLQKHGITVQHYAVVQPAKQDSEPMKVHCS